MDWDNLRYFLALARGGTLSAAARLLQVEHATIARRIAALEAETRLKLVDRRGRRLSLTAEGERIAAIAGRMDRETFGVERLAHGQDGALTGEVCISVPPAFGAIVLTPRLAALQQQHPGLLLRIIGENRHASLDQREADVAVRLSRPIDGDLTIVKLGDMVFRFYANPAYLAAVDPKDWTFVAYDESMDEAPQQARLLRFANGRPIRLRASTADIQLAATRTGGVAILPDFLAADDPDVVPAIPEEAPMMRPIWLVVHTDMKDVPGIRAVVHCLRGSFTQKDSQRVSGDLMKGIDGDF